MAGPADFCNMKVTKELLAKIFPKTPASKRDRFVAPFNTILPKYGVTTKKRFAAFIANAGIESDRLKTLKEYGAASYFNKYNGRKDLGNIRTGDGPRYKGRSVLQTTGRYNYWRVVVAYLRVLTGKNWDSTLAKSGPEGWDTYLKSKEYDNLLKEADKYNVNFLAHPELLEKLPHGVEAAGVFVKDNNLNKYADKGEAGFSAYAGVLNRGDAKKKALHYSDRLAIYKLAMRVIPDDFNLSVSTPVVPDPVPLVEELQEASDATLEISHTQVEQTDEGSTISQTVGTTNEQDVNAPATVADTQPYNGVGFIKTLKGDLVAVFGGNIGFEGLTQFFTHVTGLPEWLIPILIYISWAILIAGAVWIIIRLINYGIYRYDGIKKREVEAMVQTDTHKKDIEWK